MRGSQRRKEAGWWEGRKGQRARTKWQDGLRESGDLERVGKTSHLTLPRDQLLPPIGLPCPFILWVWTSRQDWVARDPNQSHHKEVRLTGGQKPPPTFSLEKSRRNKCRHRKIWDGRKKRRPFRCPPKTTTASISFFAQVANDPLEDSACRPEPWEEGLPVIYCIWRLQ